MGDDGAGRVSKDPDAALVRLKATSAEGPTAESLVIYDTVLAHFDADGSDRAERRVVVRALFEKARALAGLGRSSESNAVVADLVKRFEYDTNREPRWLVCRALFGQAKDRLSEHKIDRRSVLVDYRHVLHIADRSPTIEALAAEALYHLALTHERIAREKALPDHLEKAAQRHEEVERRFGQSQDPAIVHWVARCMASRALGLEPTEAGPAYERIFDRYAKRPEPELQVYAMDALLQWAERLLAAERLDLAAGVATRVLVAFSAVQAPVLRKRLDVATRIRGEARKG